MTSSSLDYLQDSHSFLLLWLGTNTVNPCETHPGFSRGSFGLRLKSRPPAPPPPGVAVLYGACPQPRQRVTVGCHRPSWSCGNPQVVCSAGSERPVLLPTSALGSPRGRDQGSRDACRRATSFVYVQTGHQVYEHQSPPSPATTRCCLSPPVFCPQWDLRDSQVWSTKLGTAEEKLRRCALPGRRLVSKCDPVS